jgi:hypothetical protein
MTWNLAGRGILPRRDRSRRRCARVTSVCGVRA